MRVKMFKKFNLKILPINTNESRNPVKENMENVSSLSKGLDVTENGIRSYDGLDETQSSVVPNSQLENCSVVPKMTVNKKKFQSRVLRNMREKLRNAFSVEHRRNESKPGKNVISEEKESKLVVAHNPSLENSLEIVSENLSVRNDRYIINDAAHESACEYSSSIQPWLPLPEVVLSSHMSLDHLSIQHTSTVSASNVIKNGSEYTTQCSHSSNNDVNFPASDQTVALNSPASSPLGICASHHWPVSFQFTDAGLLEADGIHNVKRILTVHKETYPVYPFHESLSKHQGNVSKFLPSTNNGSQQIIEDISRNEGSCIETYEAGDAPVLPYKKATLDTHERVRRDPIGAHSSSQASPEEQAATKSWSQEFSDISKHNWYWGPIKRHEAEEQLSKCSDGVFLVRDSSDDRYLLSLSFRSSGKTFHTRIEHSNGLFSFNPVPEHRGYPTLAELIDSCVASSNAGVFCYSKARNSNNPGFPVRLCTPLSRATQVQPLQSLCSFVILQHTRLDLVPLLPLPPSLTRLLAQKHR
ncbi:uncharacterized protein LOC108675093 [Hyalella azteca]|uniref:Uncharacterized protein LOC108675093 n=1 Tax=Hyalella azteca TaxID=294128 RepID=A0A8B7NXU7_HYAAZ|nr:uncharacterized protein LOC108675093 [Hyalella azteca]